jgi:hypothetical protein
MIEESASKPKPRAGVKAVLLFGLVYGAIGIGFAACETNETAIFWRRAAWLASALAFAFHIGHEHFRLRNSPATTALHVSLAAAFGAFVLAVAANVHALKAATGNRPLLALALVLWPIITGMPAFLVALVLAALLGRLRRTSSTAA